MSGAHTPEVKPKMKDCLACRLTGAAAFGGIGAYALYQSKAMGTFKTKRPPGGPLVAGQASAVLGLVFISLGLGRLIL